MANAIQEQDGSTSMRRVLAAYFALLSGACFILATIYKSMPGFYSGAACVLASLVLLGYTTLSDIKEIVSGRRSVPPEPKGEPIGFKPEE